MSFFRRTMGAWRRWRRQSRYAPAQRQQVLSRYKVARLSRRLNSIEKGKYKELKTHDIVPYTTAPTTTGVIIPLSAMGQGDTSLLREGLQLQPRNLQYKLYFQIHADGAAVATNVRVMIFQDQEMHGDWPIPTDLLESDNTTAFVEHDTRPRFKIFRDFFVTLSKSGPNYSGFMKGIIKFGKHSKIWYQGTDSTEASQGKNSLFLYIVSNEAGAGTAPITLIQTRLRFVDG